MGRLIFGVLHLVFNYYFRTFKKKTFPPKTKVFMILINEKIKEPPHTQICAKIYLIYFKVQAFRHRSSSGIKNISDISHK